MRFVDRSKWVSRSSQIPCRVDGLLSQQDEDIITIVADATQVLQATLEALWFLDQAIDEPENCAWRGMSRT